MSECRARAEAERATPTPESANGSTRPIASAEEWLGRNREEKRRLWERLNPRHRRLLRVLAHALVFSQDKARLPEPTRTRLLAALYELERVARRLEQVLALDARKNPSLFP